MSALDILIAVIVFSCICHAYALFSVRCAHVPHALLVPCPGLMFLLAHQCRQGPQRASRGSARRTGREAGLGEGRDRPQALFFLLHSRIIRPPKHLLRARASSR